MTILKVYTYIYIGSCNEFVGGGEGIYMYDVHIHYESSMKALIYITCINVWWGGLQ